MMRPGASALSLAVALVIATTPPATATDPLPQENPRELLESAARDMLRVLELLMESVPQYEPPEILDNGDILIRRRRPVPTPRPESTPAPAPDIKT